MRIPLFFLTLIHLVSTHNCQHRVPSKDDVVFGVPIQAPIIRKRSLSQQMRIHIYFDTSIESLSKEKRNFVRNTVVPEAVDYWQRTLRVRSGTQTIRLLRECESRHVTYKPGDSYSYCVDGCRNVTQCGEVHVPVEHLLACRTCTLDGVCGNFGTSGPGVTDSDFILYVSTKGTERCSLGSTVAYAAYCQLEASLDRPIAGYVNICPQSVSTQIHNLEQTVATIKHEILHALGFSAGLYAFYRDENGDPLTPRSPSTNLPSYNHKMQLYQWSDRVVRTVARSQWLVRKGYVKRNVHLMVTPRVVEEVRRHFNCSTLEGAELEDQGIVGTAYTHWEKRVFEHEAMTGTYTQNPVISRITLALVEDTGWYSVNYNLAEPLDWGSNLGCDFVMKSCMDWMETRRKKSESIHPFCNRPRSDKGLRTECTTDRKSVALCNLVEYMQPLPVEYQYMTRVEGMDEANLDRYAGSVELADYCPYIQEFVWKENGEIVRNSACRSIPNAGVQTQNYALETYGNKSLCLVHSGKWLLRQCRRYHELDHWGSGCYQYHCDKDRSQLVILVQGRRHLCYRENQILSISFASDKFLHDGSLVCPDCEEVCGWQCSDHVIPPPVVQDTDVPCSSSHFQPRLAFYVLIGLLLMTLGDV